MVGVEVACPSCGMDTELFLPGGVVPEPLAPPEITTPSSPPTPNFQMGNAAQIGSSDPAKGLGIASMILGICSITVVPVLTPIPAVVCGHKSRKRSKQSNTSPSGMALAGLITGYLGMIPLFLLAAMLILPALGKAKLKAQRINCENNLKMVASGLRLYEVDNSDNPPWKVSKKSGGSKEYYRPKSDKSILDAKGKPIFDVNSWRHFQALNNELSNPKVLRCPNASGLDEVTDFTKISKNTTNYKIRTDAGFNPEEVLIVCPDHGSEFKVVYRDSRVKSISKQKLLSELR